MLNVFKKPSTFHKNETSNILAYEMKNKSNLLVIINLRNKRKTQIILHFQWIKMKIINIKMKLALIILCWIKLKSYQKYHYYEIQYI